MGKPRQFFEMGTTAGYSMHGMRMGLLTAACAALCVGQAAAQTHAARTPAAKPPPAAPAQDVLAGGAQISPLFDELVEMTRQGDWGMGDWARGSILALRLFNFGPSGVPYMRKKFLQTRDPNEAFLSGAYTAMHGQTIDHKRMRAELETSPGKRAWLTTMVGDTAAMTGSLEQGQQWQQAVDFFPDMSGCRGFCQVCMQSKDELVRRAGMYWGYWIRDAAYWRTVQAARAASDPKTKAFANRLLLMRASQ